MTAPRHFHAEDPIRHVSGGWTGHVLYVTHPRVDGPEYVRVRWTDGTASTTERADDLVFANEREAVEVRA